MPGKGIKIDKNNCLRHIAIMMDGNGRWALAQNKSRKIGHIEGVKTLKKVIRTINELDVDYLTVFAFSTENWNRPQEEVDNLMDLVFRFLESNWEYALANNIRIRILGDLNKLDYQLQLVIEKAVKRTEKCNGLNFQIALNYGGRDDIVRAFRKIHNEIMSNKIVVEDVDENLVCRHLDTCDIPDPDLFVRTGGEQRISNFLLWQFAYTEFVFSETLWPDFKEDELLEIIQIFNKRNRRFGKINI